MVPGFYKNGLMTRVGVHG